MNHTTPSAAGQSPAPVPPVAQVAAGSVSSPQYALGDWVMPTVPTTGQLRVIEITPDVDGVERTYLVGRYFYESELKLVANAASVRAYLAEVRRA